MADDDSRTGRTHYTSPAIRAYLDDLYLPPDPDLAYAVAELDRAGMPRIQVSATEGKILYLLVQMIRARRVVEFGTLSGYSGLWILKAMGQDGHLWTCEYNPEHARVARGVFERAGYGPQVSVFEGPGLQSLDKLAHFAPFDAVFLDADKSGYARYARWAFEHLRPGGLIIGDNTYLFGYLAGRAPDHQWNAQAIEAMRDFHAFVAAHCTAVCLPTPDGLTVGMKPY
ncbi:O-methyltransferase [Gloeobacter morelensis]|uniref:O-methyltransferase n=1 Tax=Gloeobacter morelensis MG652769 TaxID=2781736 RepID=A0ABY3PNJ5_9CYAN|nr:O-methyltransferase [Gloeobacter morelensis]UFP95273.1 O-methyltransferase [Gloeobacter morelensis MG652769]